MSRRELVGVVWGASSPSLGQSLIQSRLVNSSVDRSGRCPNSHLMYIHSITIWRLASMASHHAQWHSAYVSLGSAARGTRERVNTHTLGTSFTLSF